MTSFSSKYNTKPNKAGDNMSFTERSTSQNKYRNNGNHRSRGNQQSYTSHKNKDKEKQVLSDSASYKEIVNNIPTFTTVSSHYFNNKHVHLPKIYKQTVLTKLNNVNHLLILKEIKWGEF